MIRVQSANDDAADVAATAATAVSANELLGFFAQTVLAAAASFPY